MAREKRKHQRLFFLALGWFFFALGIIGVLLPVVPTTPFMLLAAWAFSKSSKRFERWLLTHKYFGPPIVRFRTHRVIPLSVKLFSLSAMAVTLTVSIVSRRVPWWAIGLQLMLMGYGVWFTLRYPSSIPRPEDPNAPPPSSSK